MSRINTAGADILVQIVVDENRRFLGLITDGDIRRGLLQGHTLEAPARGVMNAKAITGRIDRHKENISKLGKLDPHRAFLPLLDAAGFVSAIALITDDNATAISALIMAGGFGSRLGELTNRKPKPLLPVGDAPILEHILRRLEATGVDSIYLSVHYLADQIRAFIAARPSTSTMKVVQEDVPMGTAGALQFLKGEVSGPVLIINGDILTNLDFKAFIRFHAQHGFDATLAVAQHRVSIPFGVVRHSADGVLLGIDEKPVITNYVAAGIYILAPEFLTLIQPGERIDMPALLERGQRKGLQAGLFPIHEYWTDVGRPEDLEKAELDHTRASHG